MPMYTNMYLYLLMKWICPLLLPVAKKFGVNQSMPGARMVPGPNGQTTENM